MPRRLVLLVLLTTLIARVEAGPAAVKSKSLAEPYKLPRDTVLVHNGQPTALVLVPTDATCAPLAAQFAARFEQITGVRLPMCPEGDAHKSHPDTRTLVVCGNAATGPLALRLYANRLVASDAAYPGASGFELRTIPIAIDTGANVLFLGGSSPEGVAAAIDAFMATLKPGPSIVVPFTIRWVSQVRKSPKPRTAEAIEKTVAEVRTRLNAFGRNTFQGVSHHLTWAARDFLLSGDDSHGRLCARLIDVMATHYREKEVPPPTFVVRELVMPVDQVEASAALTDATRLQAAEWLRRMGEDSMAFWEMIKPVRRYNRAYLGPIWNHQTHPALGIAHAALFLQARYAIPAAEYWTAVVDHLFAGQTSCDQPLEDSANYQWLVPRQTAEYALATGRLGEYFTDGVFQRCVDYTIASHDNQGNEATHGDAWMTFGSMAQPLLALVATRYRDPRCLWVLEGAGKPMPAPWSYPVAFQPAPPEDHVGLRLFTVDPLRAKAYGIEGIAPERILDKAVFRSGTDPDADYMMLDGLNTGAHKHADANAIIRFSSARHYWLVDMDYIRAAPKHHNSIVVVRDGDVTNQGTRYLGDAHVPIEQPYAAELVCSAAGPGAALTQSLLPDYKGLDWRRSIFWKAKDFFVVVDTLRARTPGDYVVRAIWRTLGEAAIAGNTLQVRQRGHHALDAEHARRLEEDGRTVVELRRQNSMLVFEQDLQPGVYRVEVLAKASGKSSNSVWVRVDGRHRIPCYLPTDVYGESRGSFDQATPGGTFRIAAAGTHRFEISLRKKPAAFLDKLVLTPENAEALVIEAEDILAAQPRVMQAPDHHFAIVNADGAVLKLRDQFDYGTGGVTGNWATYPYAGPMTRVLTQTKTATLAQGDTLTFANLFYARQGGEDGAARELRPCGNGRWLVTGTAPAVVGLGPGAPGGTEITGAMFMLTQDGLLVAGSTGPVPKARREELSAMLSQCTSQALPAPEPKSIPPLPLPDLAVRWQRTMSSPVTAVRTGPAGMLCGTHAGRVSLLSPEGDTVWKTDMGSRVRSVAFAVFAEGRRVCLVGTHAGQAKALEADTGRELWAYQCEPYSGRVGSVGTIFAADLDGDGAHEVVAGADNWHYHGLSDRGELLWRVRTTHASTVGCAGDCTGDGRDDVAAGTEYYGVKLLDHAGKKVTSSLAGPVTTAVAIFDIDGDGKAESFFGTEDGFVRCLKDKQPQAHVPNWQANVGGAPTAILPCDVDEDGKPELVCASESFSVYALRADGSRAWRTQLPDCVNGAASVGRWIMAACDDLRLYVLDRTGTVVAAADVPAPPSVVSTLDNRTAVVAAGTHLLAVTTPD